MGFIAKDKGNADFKRIPVGSHVARCYLLVDMGEQLQDGKYGQTVQHKIRLGWEVFGEDETGAPLTVEIDGVQRQMTIGKTYTLSLNEKAGLRKDLISWRGRDFTPEELEGFDIANILNVYCMLNITTSEKDGKTYTNISAITPLPSSMKNLKPQPDHQVVTFNLDEPDWEAFEALPDWLSDTIKKSPQYAELAAMPREGF
jgi:hypothetical protein